MERMADQRHMISGMGTNGELGIGRPDRRQLQSWRSKSRSSREEVEIWSSGS